MLYRARCSRCGNDGLCPPGTKPFPCSICGGKTFVFVPGHNVRRAGKLVLLSAATGYVMWFLVFLSSYLQGRINFVPGNVQAMTDFLLSLVALLSTSFASFYGFQCLRGSFPQTILSGCFGFFASLIPGVFGLYNIVNWLSLVLVMCVGIFFSLASIIISIIHRKDFYV